MYLLDTNHCSDILTKQNPNTITKLRTLPKDTQVAINAIIYGELVLMVEKSQRKIENWPLLESFIKRVRIYPLDAATSIYYGSIHAALFNYFAPRDKSKRRTFRVQDAGLYSHDLWITATALQHNLTIVTSDSDFDRIQEVTKVQMESWRGT